MALIKSYQNYLSLNYLVWDLTDQYGMEYLPKIYVGYYGSSILLKSKDGTKFKDDFMLTSPNYTLANFYCQMGYYTC